MIAWWDIGFFVIIKHLLAKVESKIKLVSGKFIGCIGIWCSGVSDIVSLGTDVRVVLGLVIDLCSDSVGVTFTLCLGYILSLAVRDSVSLKLEKM